MPATQSLDVEKFVHFVTLLDSDSDGEATSAMLRMREEMARFRCRFADVIETDAYLEAMTKQSKPNCRRTPKTDDRKLGELRAVNERLTAQLASVQADRTAEQAGGKDRYDALLRLFNEQKGINARLLKKTRGERSWVKKVAVVLLLLGALAVMRTQWGSSGTDGGKAKRISDLRDRTAKEVVPASPRRK